MQGNKIYYGGKSFIHFYNTNIAVLYHLLIFSSDELRDLIDNKFDFIFKVLDAAKSKEIKKSDCVS